MVKAIFPNIPNFPLMDIRETTNTTRDLYNTNTGQEINRKGESW